MIAFTRFRVSYKVMERAAFPAHKAPLFQRGLLRALDAACQVGASQAPMAGLCPPRGAPLPFAYAPPVDRRTRLFVGDALNATLVLVGPALDHAVCWIEALDRNVRRGLGPDRCRVIVEQVDWFDPRDRKWTRYYFSREQEIRSRPVPFDARHVEERAALLRGRARITLQFATPLRLAGAVTAASVLGALHARLDVLSRRWCGAGLAAPSLQGVQLAEATLETRERPRRAPERVGTITLAGTLDPWFPLLVAGQHLHIGYGAALGYGRYELRP